MRPIPCYLPFLRRWSPQVEAVLLLGIEDDAKCGAVLHRASGIHEFGFAENFAAGQFGKAPQSDKRGLADVSVDPAIFHRFGCGV